MSMFNQTIEEMCERPPVLPIADYPGVVRNAEIKEGMKKSVQINVSVMEWAESVSYEERKRVGRAQGRMLNKRYWADDETGKWDRRLGQLLKELGFSGDPELALAQMQGKRVLICVNHRKVTKDRDGNLLSPEDMYDVENVFKLIGVED